MDMDESVEPQMEMEKIENENRYIRLRKIYKLTQLEMADLLGYKSRSNISDLEIGRVNPSMGKLKDFHALFGIDPSWLMGIIETPYTEEIIASAEKASAELAKELSDDMENNIDLYSFYRKLYGKHKKEDYTLENRFHMLFMANYVIHVLYRVWGRHYKSPWPKEVQTRLGQWQWEKYRTYMKEMRKIREHPGKMTAGLENPSNQASNKT